MYLNELRTGDHAEILKIEGRGVIRQRLLDMGLVPGVCLHLLRVAPLGDPIELSVRGFLLSLRKEEAAHIMVKEVPMGVGPCRHRPGRGFGWGRGRGRGHGPGRGWRFWLRHGRPR